MPRTLRARRRFTIESGEILLDYSKHRIDAETMRLLAALAVQAQVPQWIAKMFAGDPINNTEERAALHVALRSRDAAFPEGRSVMAEVRGTRERMRRFVGEAHSGALRVRAAARSPTSSTSASAARTSDREW